MSSAWFGLIGVVVGGLISTVWSWLAVVRQELSDAMVAARLVNEDLLALQSSVSKSPEHGRSRPDTDTWFKQRVALAKVLGKERWEAVAAIYRGERTQARTRQKRSRNSSAMPFGELAPLVAGKRYVIPQRWRNTVKGVRNAIRRRLGRTQSSGASQ